MNKTNRAQQIVAQWQALPMRERRAITLAVAVVFAAALWLVALRPAIHTLHTAPAQRLALQAETRHMQALKQQAQALEQIPKPSAEQARVALTSSTEQLLASTASLNINNSEALITLKDTPADRLSTWLTEIRVNAHALPQRASLQRSGDNDSAVRWSGTIILSLPS